MAIQTYHGSCSCGKVRFEAAFDLASGTFKCNCTVCLKKRFWGAMAKNEDVRVLDGEREMTFYGDRRKHYFCRICGTKLFGRSDTRAAVNLAALDDLDPREWASTPVRYVDGRHDRFDKEPEFKGHL